MFSCNDNAGISPRNFLKIAIVGPTASGKTEISIGLAQSLNAEIISADSMQIWKMLNIGTAKPTPYEKTLAVFHLVDFVEPFDSFSAAQFGQSALSIINDIEKREKNVILCGGTGLYIRAIVDGLHFAPKASLETREKLKMESRIFGLQSLYNRLGSIDPTYHSKVSPNDEKRIIRALEVWETTGRTMSSYQEEDSQRRSLTDWLIFGIQYDADKLNERINKRVDRMIKDGLIEEVSQLVASGFHEGLQSACALGYQEVLGYLRGKWTRDEAIELIKINTRRYAKRQRTWFRSDSRIRWIDATDKPCEDVVLQIQEAVREKSQGSDIHGWK